MKKSLIAVAVAAALPAAAFAQSSVQMYGIADVYVTSVDSDRGNALGMGGSGLRVDSGGQSTSRWGVKGSEDLGGGLAGIFQLESQLNIDVGGGFNDLARRAYVGIKGGFGQITLGRDYTPMFWTVIDNDQGGMAHLLNDASLGQANRTSNGINYEGKFGGLQVNALYSPGGQAGGGNAQDAADPNNQETAADDILGIGLGFDGGSWGINAAFHDQSGTDVMHVGGEVKFGTFGLGLNYVDVDGAPDPSYGVSATLGVGASGNILLNVTDLANGDTRFQLYYRHNLSKRTNWYAGYADRDTGGSQISVGLRHRF